MKHSFPIKYSVAVACLVTVVVAFAFWFGKREGEDAATFGIEVSRRELNRELPPRSNPNQRGAQRDVAGSPRLVDAPLAERVGHEVNAEFSDASVVSGGDVARLRRLAEWTVRDGWGETREDVYGAKVPTYDLSELDADDAVLVDTLDEHYPALSGTDVYPGGLPDYYYVVVSDKRTGMQFLEIFAEVTIQGAGETLVVQRGSFSFYQSNPIPADRPPFPLVTSEDGVSTLSAIGITVATPSARVVNIPFPILDPREVLYEFGVADTHAPAFVRAYDGRPFRNAEAYKAHVSRFLGLENEIR